MKADSLFIIDFEEIRFLLLCGVPEKHYFHIPFSSISLPAVITDKFTYPGAGRIAGVILLQILMLWLTVCLPLVSRSMQRVKPESSRQIPLPSDDDQNPVSGLSEEKTAGAITLTEELLHEQEEPVGIFIDFVLQFLLSGQNIYLAYHGELFSPPPDPVI